MSDKIYEEKEIGDLCKLMHELMELREHGFWSFRGQRNEKYPLGLHHLPDDERLLPIYLNQFKKRCIEFPKPDYIDEFDSWRWLFFAQHHRLKTRLLDWTSNPMVAIYFAVENIISKHANNENVFGAVWALKVNNENFKSPDDDLGTPDSLKRWQMINPPPVTPRIVRQSGKFSYHPKNDDKLLSEHPMRKGEALKKFIIKCPDSGRNPSKTLLEQLGIMNIHHASLFPGPEGVANFINNEWPIIALDREMFPDQTI